MAVSPIEHGSNRLLTAYASLVLYCLNDIDFNCYCFADEQRGGVRVCLGDDLLSSGYFNAFH